MAAHTVLSLLLIFLVVGAQSNYQIFAPNSPFSVNVTDLKTTVVTFVNKVKNILRCSDHGLLPANCEKCLDQNQFFDLLHLEPSSGILTLQTAEDISMLLVHHILYFEEICEKPNPVGCESFNKCQETVLRAFGSSSHLLDSTKKLLRIFKVVLKQDNANECFNAEQLLTDLQLNKEERSQKQEVRQVLRLLMGRIFKGQCIDAQESVTDFLDDIFHHYGEDCSPYMNLEGLKRMIHDLQNSEQNHDHDLKHNHHHGHNHDHKEHHECHHHNELFSLYHSHDHNYENHRSNANSENLANYHNHADHEHYDHAHSNHHNHANHDHEDHEGHSSHDSFHDHEHSGHDHEHSGHDHEHSGHDHDHSIKHDRLLHSHGDADNHRSEHAPNRIESAIENVTSVNVELQKNTEIKEHIANMDKNFENSSNISIDTSQNFSYITTSESSLNVHIDNNTISSNSSKPSEVTTHDASSYIETSGTGLNIGNSARSTMLTPEISTTISSRVQRSSENMAPAFNGDIRSSSEDFNAPSASLKSEFSHQEEKLEDGHHHHFDDIRKVSLLRNDEGRRNIKFSSLNENKFASLAAKCLTVEELILKFGHQQNSSLTKEDFLELCPALIQQIVSGVCVEPAPISSPLPSRAEVYGYGSLSVLVISLTSLAGVLLLPIMTKRAYSYIIAGFYGLAFSTLAGDALLHLVPQFLGLHMHSADGSHDHSHDNASFLEPFAQLQLGVFFTIYGLFLFEAILCAISSNGRNSSQDKSHGHSHGHLPDQLPTLISVKSKSETQLPVSRDQSSSSLDTEIVEMDSMKKPPNLMVSKPVCFGLTSMALVVTLGDSIHNFGDGLAIGAAFSNGIRGGLSTAIAVFCHELPHEFGDFVVLLSTGLSFSKAMVINFLSGLTCFAGLYIGIYIGDNEIARKWVMAVTAGIFLYVALGEMIPELREHNQGSPVKMLLVKNVGILAGILIMLVISMYEGEMM